MSEFRKISVEEKIRSVTGEGDVLFIVPPFTNNTPVIGPHILQAIAREKGYKADILYLNLLLASIIGYTLSESLGTSEQFQYWIMLNERLFARSAYGLPPLGESPETCTDEAIAVSGNTGDHRKMDYDEPPNFDLNEYMELEKTCFQFVKDSVNAIAGLSYNIIGLTTRMGQTNCSIALINGVKKIRPDITAIIGGSNCQGTMAEGIASLSPDLDYVFSMESEIAFSRFLDDHTAGNLPGERIVTGPLVDDMDSLPGMDFESYFRQLDFFFNGSAPGTLYVWAETSRGCWWGEKNKCTFCSRNNSSLRFRSKSPQKVLEELKDIKDAYPGVYVAMADNIMPYTYYTELLPLLGEKEKYPSICLHYMKANLKLQDLIHLKKARVLQIVPGIETLSTGLLGLLNKGVTARDNLQLLRNARSVGVHLLWFMLWGAPGDKVDYYQDILELLPLIRHLEPPRKFFRVQLERFSSYVTDPEAHGIENLRPWHVYDMVFPQWADTGKLAFGFTGEYRCGAYERPELIREIARQLEGWRQTWKELRLTLFPVADYYMIHDSRGIPGTTGSHALDTARAKEIMTYGVYNGTENQDWAVEQKLGTVLDSWYVPLVTASQDVLMEFEEA